MKMAKISALQDMLFERGLFMTHALQFKNVYSLVTKDDEGVMGRWNFSFGNYLVLSIKKYVRKLFFRILGLRRKRQN